MDGVSVAPTREFDRFTGSLHEFENSQAWRGAYLQAVLESQADDREVFRYYLERSDERLKTDFDRHYRIEHPLREEWANSDYQVTPLPIKAAIDVYVAGKPIWRANGWLAHVWEHDEDVRLLLVARFPSSSIAVEPTARHAGNERSDLLTLIAQ